MHRKDFSARRRELNILTARVKLDVLGKMPTVPGFVPGGLVCVHGSINYCEVCAETTHPNNYFGEIGRPCVDNCPCAGSVSLRARI
jgi:hypothetical protein